MFARNVLTGRAAAVALLALLVAACGGEDDTGAGPSPSPTSSSPTSESSAASSPAAEPSPGVDLASLSAEIDNPFVPLDKVTLTVFEGEERDGQETIRTRVEQRLLSRTETVAGVDAAVVAVREWENGELVERTFDYYAQDADGNVWYMGEHVNDYEDGKLSGHGGQWLAGENGAQPGLFMPAEPEVGVTFEQERAPGVAEDESTVVETGVDVTVPAGSFTGCIKTEDYAPLDGATEFKFYCPDVGLVREQGKKALSELVRYS